MTDESEPTVVMIWERLDPHDRKALADLVGIPEGQLALTRLSNVVLKLLGALGHVRQAEKAKILAEMERAKIAIERQQIVQQMQQQMKQGPGAAVAALKEAAHYARKQGNLAHAAKLTEEAHRLEHLEATQRAIGGPSVYFDSKSWTG